MTIEKIAISIDRELLNRVEQYIDGKEITNRSQAISHLLRKALGFNIKKALILAGGKDGDQRALIKINGKPLILHNIEWLKGFGIEEIYIATLKDSRIKDILPKSEIKIEIFEEDKPIGTAGAIKRICKGLKETIVILNGDNLYEFDLHKMLEKHTNSNNYITMGLQEVENAHEYGQAILEGDRIVDFREKSKGVTHIINAGVYIISPNACNYIPSVGMLEHTTFPKLAMEGKLGGYILPLKKVVIA